MKLRGQLFRFWFVLLSVVAYWLNSPAAEAFALRGYYLTFMRMAVMGLPEWKQAMDCFAEDGANVIILWTTQTPCSLAGARWGVWRI
jgi:hypothetical protein